MADFDPRHTREEFDLAHQRVREVVMDLRQRRVACIIPDNLTMEASRRPDMGMFATELVMKLNMACQRLDQVVTKEFPASDWDWFKHMFFPRWLQKRYPVRMERYKLQVFAYYPEVVADRQHIKFAVMERL